MSFIYPHTGLVTLVTLAVYFWMSLQTAKVRSKTNTPAPAMTGPDELMRAIRVHENTMEGLILFLPALWLFALTIGDIWAALVGIFYPIGRIVYALGYYAAANKRSRGFMIGLISTAILYLGALIALVMAAIQAHA
ncbi:MAG: MAPEG family protein [Parvibaculum sp.]|jgi:glutathione S-transferase|uniref:MAPEG family protein n=1 Tax=Parvibaculum sp. TaxID=2024848 RepID=UPI00283F6966|nr:MAPEG family protein [Parvibaculum sp.]MDR3498266.1 MAPEG family protein [Parvibaculum sp.]